MPINLERFTRDEEVICPIFENWGIYNGRKLEFRTEDGWYKIRLGNKAKIIKKATPLEIEKTLANEKSYIGYPIGQEFIGASNDSLRRKGMGESVRFFGESNCELFSSAKFVEWGDKRFYFYKESPGYHRETLKAIKDCFEKGKPIKDIKGVTPEERLLFIIARLYQNSYDAFKEFERTMVAESVRQKALEKFQLDIGVRLRNVIDSAGGTYIRHSKRGNGYLVTWEVGGQTVKTQINDSMRIINAGFCLNGDDEKHSMSSITLLAQLFQQGGRRLYITRE